MANVDVQKIINELPAGIDRAILQVLSFHVGKDHAISRPDLLERLGMVGFRINDRSMRAGINQLRKDGKPICSTGGVDGGYYLAKDWEELDEFITREIHSRAMDLLEQEKLLRSGAEKLWGKYSPSLQARLF